MQAADRTSTMDSDNRQDIVLAAVLMTWLIQGAVCACVPYDGGQSRCFEANSELTTWDDAREACKRLGMRLAVVESQAVLNFVISYLTALWNGPTTSWVGLRWNATVNQETWPTGQTLDVASYDSGRASQHVDGLDCRFIHSLYSLENGPCSAAYGRVCELAGSSQPPSVHVLALKVFRRLSEGAAMNDVSAREADLDAQPLEQLQFACARQCVSNEQCRAFSTTDNACTIYVILIGSYVKPASAVAVYQKLFE